MATKRPELAQTVTIEELPAACASEAAGGDRAYTSTRSMPPAFAFAT